MGQEGVILKLIIDEPQILFLCVEKTTGFTVILLVVPRLSVLSLVEKNISNCTPLSNMYDFVPLSHIQSRW